MNKTYQYEIVNKVNCKTKRIQHLTEQFKSRKIYSIFIKLDVNIKTLFNYC